MSQSQLGLGLEDVVVMHWKWDCAWVSLASRHKKYWWGAWPSWQSESRVPGTELISINTVRQPRNGLQQVSRDEL